MAIVSDRFVCLPGLTLPIEPVLLALDLENRGLRLELDGDALVVGPRDRITLEDRVQIQRWREHLKAIVAHAEGRVQ